MLKKAQIRISERELAIIILIAIIVFILLLNAGIIQLP